MKTKSELRQHKLFVEDHIIKAVLRVSLPAIIIALMAGLYAFADQVMMVNLIPHVKDPQDIYGAQIWSQFQDILTKIHNNNLDIHITNYDTATIIRTAVAYTAPVTVLITAAALLIGNGTGINYTRYSGQGNSTKAQTAWTVGFWSNLIWSIIISVIIIGFATVLINVERGHQLQTSLDKLKERVDETNFTTSNFNVVSQVYHSAYDTIKTYSTHFIYIIGAGAMFAIYSQFLSLLIISEGKQIFAVVSAIVCNVINVLLDFVLIWYAKLAMIGGAIAIVLGWTLNSLSYIWYISFMDHHHDTNLHLKSLFHMKQMTQTVVLSAMLWSIFSLGLPSFLRNISMAVAATVQLAILAYVIGRINVRTGSTYTNSDYQDIYGAVNPIYNLFYTATVGIINGARITMSYNHATKNMKRVRQSYWLIGSIGAIWGILCVLVVGFGIGTPLLNLFDINSNAANFHTAKYMLWITLIGLPLFGAQMGGMALFQATNQWWRASICGIMQGVICNFTISFAIMGIAIATNSINVFLWNTFIVLAVAVMIVTIYSAVYMYKHYKDPKRHQPLKNTYSN